MGGLRRAFGRCRAGTAKSEENNREGREDGGSLWQMDSKGTEKMSGDSKKREGGEGKMTENGSMESPMEC